MAYDYRKNGPNTTIAKKESNPIMAEKPDFGVTSSISASMGMTPAAAREVARIQAKVISAKCYPRDPMLALQKIEKECTRKAIAENALYEYARGGSSIAGPSIRLAESLARCWGNVDYGFEEMESDNGASKVRAFAIDYETNTSAERVFLVEHSRSTKKGKVSLDDPRDIYETIANNAARRMRACILEIIPGDVVDYGVSICRETVTSSINITPDTINRIIEAFAAFHINRNQLEAFIQRNIDSITPTQYTRLQSIFASLRDGVAKPEDFFDMTIDAAPKDTANASFKEPPKKIAAAPVAEDKKNNTAAYAPVEDKKQSSPASVAVDDGLKGPEYFVSSPLPGDDDYGLTEEAGGELDEMGLEEIWGK